MDEFILFSSTNRPDERMEQEIYSVMSEAFPACERKNREDFLAQFSQSHFFSLCAIRGGELAGFLNFWDFGQFVYIEHFAVRQSLRGGGTGTALLSHVQKSVNKPIVLEAEPANLGETAVRRLEYYRRCGFCNNPYPYIQPSMQAGEPPVPLVIMSSPKPLSEQEFACVRDKLYSDVYK